MDANELLDEYYPTIDHVELGKLYCRDKVIIIMKEYAEKWHESEVNKLKQADVIKSVCVCECETGGYRYGENDKTKCSTCGKEKQTVL